MGLFDNNRRNNGGLLAGLNAQVTRQDVRNGPNFPINPGPLPGGMPFKGGGPMPGGPGMSGDPRMNTAEARGQQEKIDNSSRLGTFGSLLGGLAGTLIPVPILGTAIGSMVGGGLGQLAGGVKPDFRDILGYGTSGAIGGAAGGLVSGLAGQAGGALARTLGTVGGGYLGGRLGVGAAANTLGLNSEYDPRYRYFVNPNNREIQSTY